MAKPTINEVAALAGVSKKTVSRVINRSPLINPATRIKIERVIAEIGFVPNPQARALALKRNFIVTLVHDCPDDPALLDVQAGMQHALQGSEYILSIHRIDAAADTFLRDFADFLEYRRPSGVLLMPGLAGIQGLETLCWEFSCGFDTPGCIAVSGAAHSAQRVAMARQIEHLVLLGHRRIGFIAGPETDPDAEQRELGYLDALAEHDLDRGPALIAGGDGSFASGLAAAALLLEVSPAPTAIVAATDAMAAGAIHAAAAKRLTVPADVSIAGFGDTQLARSIHPALTSARLPLHAMAFTATRRLTATGFDQPCVAETGDDMLVITPIFRGSTGPAPSQLPGQPPVQPLAVADLSDFQSG